jgi:glycosyltransferase involved in cell wall biosynthesis
MKGEGMEDLTVLIATRNRAASLTETLEGLAAADASGIEVGIRVVDNGTDGVTHSVVEAFQPRLPVRYLYEPIAGKGAALNRALDESRTGDLVAVVDDDMSLSRDWFKGVMAISRRWPQCSFFSGRSYILWPPMEIPLWAYDLSIRPWAFSVVGSPRKRDIPIEPGKWPSGNHFWFRSSVLEGNRRFRNVWATEPWFFIELQEKGHKGVFGPEAVAGHRVQPHLLDLSIQRERAVIVGTESAKVYAAGAATRRGILLHTHPHLMSGICRLLAVRWSLVLAATQKGKPEPAKTARELYALERRAMFTELMRIVREGQEAHQPTQRYPGGSPTYRPTA